MKKRKYREPKRTPPQGQAAEHIQNIKVLEAKIASLRVEITCEEAALLQAVYPLIPAEVITEWGTQVDDLILGVLHCPHPQNDSRVCVYDETHDGACDFCLFCGEPEERK